MQSTGILNQQHAEGGRTRQSDSKQGAEKHKDVSWRPTEGQVKIEGNWREGSTGRKGQPGSLAP